MDRTLRRMGVREGVLIGAGNPIGRRLAEGCNARLHRALLERVHRLPWCEGEGVGRGWRERHLLLGCAPGRVVALAQLFRQGGVMVVRLGRPARLVVLRQ